MFKKNFSTIVAGILVLASVLGVVYAYFNVRDIVPEGDVAATAPRIFVSETEYDWGEIPESSPVTKDIVVRNDGKSDLEIGAILTSCACTTFEFFVGDSVREIPVVLSPKEEGVLHIVFDPAVMDSSGEVRRAVRIESNDPTQPFVVINLDAYVQ
jgi:hypothetical protein